MIEYSDAIWSLYKDVPNLTYAIANNSYDEFVWETPNVEKPSKAELDAELSRLQAEYDAKQYQRDRAAAYPSIQEQLDMQYWDAINGTTVWQDTINAVKQQYPKE